MPCDSSTVAIYVNDTLRVALQDDNISEAAYGPAYAGESAGLDLYNAGPECAIPPFCNHRDDTPVKTLVPTGLRIALPSGTVALLRERGSITKTPLKLRAGVIDKNFTGEIFVNLVNLSLKEYKIASGAKLPVQLVVVDCINQFEVVDKTEYSNLTKGSRRKVGQVGSSDKNALEA